jgi:hypothetical protein
LGHQRLIILTDLIPFQEGKLRKMPVAPLIFAETPADLKYFVKSGHQQTLHAQFRGCVQKPISGGFSIYMRLGGRRWNAYRGFDLQKALVDEKAPDRLNHPGPEFQMATDGGLSECAHGCQKFKYSWFAYVVGNKEFRRIA